MKQLIEQFPSQLEESLTIYEKSQIEFGNNFSNVLICGLGGSGIGGELVKKWVFDELKVPIEICHNYEIPKYVSDKTLVIACSYSGNTEETLNALDQCIHKGASIVAITSGGALQLRASEHGFPVVLIPGGHPPRAALAYSLVQVVGVLTKTGMIAETIINSIHSSVELLKNESKSINEEAKVITDLIKDKKTVIYGEEKFKAVAVRACQQLNENSKELCWANVIPEMNHNELVGWASGSDLIATVILRSPLEYYRNSVRLDITASIIKEKTPNVHVLLAKGANLVEESMYFIHCLDWVSYFLAELKGVDVVEVKVIDYLKGELEKI